MAMCIQSGTRRGGGRGRRDADKTSLKEMINTGRSPVAAAEPVSGEIGLFLAGAKHLWCHRHFHAFFAPPGYFYCLSPSHNTSKALAGDGGKTLTLVRRVLTVETPCL
jgi:hypothetical protein